MNKRVQITVGPKAAAVVKKIAARYRKETSTEWSDTDVLESAAAHGLRHMQEHLKLAGAILGHCRE